MSIDTSRLPYAKPKRKKKAVQRPIPRQRIRLSKKSARRRRQEIKIVRAVRPTVEQRDGSCRWLGLSDLLGACEGESQWAHAPWKTRASTRGQAPEDRHTTQDSLMACTHHHDAIDGRAQPRMYVTALTEHGCDGRLRAERAGIIYEEPA